MKYFKHQSIDSDIADTSVPTTLIVESRGRSQLSSDQRVSSLGPKLISPRLPGDPSPVFPPTSSAAPSQTPSWFSCSLLTPLPVDTGPPLFYVDHSL